MTNRAIAIRLFAVGVGVDLSVFLWRSGLGPMAIEGPRPSVFAFAGVQGRFDYFGVF